MGRVNRLMERRHLRRAADQALMTPAFLRPLDMPAATPSTAPPFDIREDADFTDAWGDTADTNGDEPVDAITEPIAVAALHDRLRNTPDHLGPDDLAAPSPRADRPASAPIGTWKPDLIEFRVVQRWYRTKAVAATLAAVALAAIVGSSILLVSRGAEQATSVTPQASTAESPPPSGAPPAPRHVPPAASNTPPAPPPPPPPPPATTASPPPVARNPWSPSPPSPTKKPEFGVTRAPFSAAPPPPPPPGTNSATPGDGRKRWGPW